MRQLFTFVLTFVITYYTVVYWVHLVKGISVSDARHLKFAYSIQEKQRWDIKKLQYWLGHTDTQTTLNIYAHFNRQRLNTSDNDLSDISLASAELFS